MSGAHLRTRTARLRTLAGAATLVAAVAASVLAAPAAVAAEPVLPEGQTASSKGMTLLANMPKTGAFAGSTNSDLAFTGDYAIAGNYNGFTVWDIKKPQKPTQVVQLVCPGSQNDVTVHRNLLFLSVDQRRTDDTCTSGVATADQSRSGAYWEGVRIFDISNPAVPVYVTSVETDCGSHTHTLVPGKDGKDVFLYVSSYGPVGDGSIARCVAPHDKISIVKVPVASPDQAAVVAEPVLFEDGGLVARTQGCHDITAYPAKGLAAGACMGEGVVFDISTPDAPVVLERVADTENFAFWHSATFSNKADKVLFTDELGGGGSATCNPTVGPKKGANAIYTLDADRQLTFGSYYKIGREQGPTENCVAHNGSLIPVDGKDIMVQSWYQGGISVFDWTDPKKPVELGWFDRGALPKGASGGTWSAYYYKGYIYSNEIARGFDVLEFRHPSVASAKSGKYPADFNVQTQPTY